MLIRAATTADAEVVTAIYAPWVTTSHTSFELTAPTVAEMARRIEATTMRYPWLVAVIEGTVAGYAYAAQHQARAAYQWSVGVSVYVHGEFYRCGVGRRLYEALFAILRRQGYINAYADIALPNPASVALHEALGFEPIGVCRDVGFKLNGWRDVGWWGLRLQPPPPDPPPPVPFPRLPDTREPH
ncbi:MAG: arsinothricin resistance N-acetyltransferase ArsN1 family B [Egibacteraceae bacterium]